VGRPVHHSAKKPPLSLKSVNIDDKIMEIGLICPNLIEKSHHSSNPGPNPEHDLIKIHKCMGNLHV
jgi:hypothetical protein